MSNRTIDIKESELEKLRAGDRMELDNGYKLQIIQDSKKTDYAKTFVVFMVDSDQPEELSVKDLEDEKRHPIITSFYVKDIREFVHKPRVLDSLGSNALFELIKKELQNRGEFDELQENLEKKIEKKIKEEEKNTPEEEQEETEEEQEQPAETASEPQEGDEG